MVTRKHVERVLAGADDLIVEVMNRRATVGLAVGVVHDGELVYAKGFGMADTATQRPVTTDTVFRIGSTSKTLTAIGLMQLWEEGRFDLDDPVAQHLRAYEFVQPAGHRPATIRDVMTHTSGAGEFNSLGDVLRDPLTGGLGVKLGRPIPSLAEHYRRGVRTDAAPGRKWAYANHAIATLGQLIEDLSGLPFADYMRERVLDPLGMTGSDFLRSERVRERLAVGYRTKRGTLQVAPDYEIIVGAAGSVFSSVEDMARYVAALTGGGANAHGAVLKPETLDLMMQQHWAVAPGVPFSMGLVFMREQLEGHTVVHHGGGWPGFISMLRVVPAAKLGVIAFTNASDHSSWDVADVLLRDLLKVRRQGQDFPPAPVLERADLWGDLRGVYAAPRGFKTNARTWQALGGEVEILVHDGHLALRSLLGPLRKPVRLHPVSADDPLLFAGVYHHDRTTSEVWLRFERGESGPATAVSGALLLPFRLERRPALRSGRRLAKAGALAAAGAYAWRRVSRGG